MIWEDGLLIGKAIKEFTFHKLHQIMGTFRNQWLSDAKETSVVIGYDTRFQSDLCGRICAAVLATYGIQVYMAKDPIPIGALLFGLKKNKAHGILITGGERGIEYNGLRLIRPGGSGLGESEWKKWEEEFVHFPFIENLDFTRAVSEGRISYQPILDDYIQFLRGIVDREKIEKSGLKIVFDSLYGTSQGIFNHLLSSRSGEICEIHDARHSMFGGLVPNVKEHNLSNLYQFIRSEQRHLGFLYDPEALKWAYVNGIKGQVILGHKIVPYIENFLRSKGLGDPFPQWKKDGILTSLVFLQSIAEAMYVG